MVDPNVLETVELTLKNTGQQAGIELKTYVKYGVKDLRLF